MPYSPMDGSARAARHAIARNRPAVNFFEGALLGNGGLGVVVCLRPDAVMFHFGHNNVWDIRLAEENREKIGTFQEVFERVKRIPDTHHLLTDDAWYDDYQRMAQENYRKPYPRPFPCGTLVLGFDRREVEALGYHLNLADGVCSVHLLAGGVRQILRLFTDMSRDHLWMNMTDEAGTPIAAPFNRVRLIPDPTTPDEFPEHTVSTPEEGESLSFRQLLPFLHTQGEDTSRPPSHPQDRAFRLRVCLPGPLTKASRMTVDGIPETMDDLERHMEASREFIAVVQLEEGLASNLADDPVCAQTDLLSGVFEEASRSSQRSWQHYWKRSAVALEDSQLEQTWYRNLYFLNCAVREGVTCPGLFANWSYKDIGTSWHGDYHMNYNTQQPFWAAFSSNHVDKHLPYVDMVHRALPVSQAWAKDYYEMRGAFFPHSLYPVEMTMNPYPVPTWGWEVFETPWTVQSLWWHYTYTRDREFLEHSAFQPLREAVLFMSDYMTRPDAHGPQWNDEDFHIFPTVPPELYGLMPGFKRNADGLIDLTLTRFLFQAFTQACQVLGKEQQEESTLSAITTILDHYPSYPTAESDHGRIFVTVDGEDPDMVYNVPASTVTVFPGEEHGLHSPEEEYAVALNSYRHQQNEGAMSWFF